MPAWLKILIAGSSGFGTAYVGTHATGGDQTVALVSGAIAAANAIAALHIDPPGKISVPNK